MEKYQHDINAGYLIHQPICSLILSINNDHWKTGINQQFADRSGRYDNYNRNLTFLKHVTTVIFSCEILKCWKTDLPWLYSSLTWIPVFCYFGGPTSPRLTELAPVRNFLFSHIYIIQKAKIEIVIVNLQWTQRGSQQVEKRGLVIAFPPFALVLYYWSVRKWNSKTSASFNFSSPVCCVLSCTLKRTRYLSALCPGSDSSWSL